MLLTSDLARGTLRFLAAHQGRRDDEFQEEEPGKILHEYRTGEMANLREIPFIPYYGSADATPLFLILLDAYVQWTDDRALLEALWPAALAALGWIDGFSERNRDGFADYQRRSAKGLHNQGWRDSWDAVFYGDGRLVEPPVALVEVQGYAYAARQAAARLARLRGEMELAARWEQAAAALRERLNRDFWWPERHTFALALDGQRRMCAVAASSPGHLLWCQAVEPAPAQQVADFLLSEEMFSGWGIRTIGSREARYNPMSYHNGSVWPHDNALIAAGFKNYELQQSLHQLVTALFDASLFFEIAVLPELFCGFPRQPTRKPVAFPVACQPQAWAAACVFLLVQSLLGLTPDAPHQQLLLKNPTLPLWLDWIELRKLRCGNLQVDLRVRRVEAGCAIEVLQKEGQGEIVVTH